MQSKFKSVIQMFFSHHSLYDSAIRFPIHFATHSDLIGSATTEICYFAHDAKVLEELCFDSGPSSLLRLYSKYKCVHVNTTRAHDLTRGEPLSQVDVNRFSLIPRQQVCYKTISVQSW